MDLNQFLRIVLPALPPESRPAARLAWNIALDSAAAIARDNTSAPRIWKDGAWHNPHGEDIALKIEALKVTMPEVK